MPVAEYEEWITKLTSGKLTIDQTAAAWWLVFVKLVYHLGLRRSGTLLAEWKSINWDACTLTVVAETSKGRRTRTLPLMPELVADLRAWRAANPDETHVLPFEGNVRRIYDDWHLIAGKDRVPKNCRSITGTALIEAGIPTAVVQKWLGHKYITTTEKYYVNPTELLRAAAAARFVAK